MGYDVGRHGGEDPEVGDPPLAKLVGLDFGLRSSEDTVSWMLHQLLLLALLFFGFNNLVSFPCLGFVFCAIGDGAGGCGIIVTGSDMLFEIFQSANVEIVCAVDSQVIFLLYFWGFCSCNCSISRLLR